MPEDSRSADQQQRFVECDDLLLLFSLALLYHLQTCVDVAFTRDSASSACKL